MERVCFRLRVRADRLDEYRSRHAAVWPEMLRALEATGWRDYAIFLADDGLLIGCFRTESLERAQAGMADTAVNARWQAEMAPFFEGLEGAPDTGFERIPLIFDLDQQLAALDGPAA